MAQATSALLVRFGYAKYWDSIWCISFINAYSLLILHDDVLFKYIQHFFTSRKKFLYQLYHYSSSKIYRVYNNLFLFIYLRSKMKPKIPRKLNFLLSHNTLLRNPVKIYDDYIYLKQVVRCTLPKKKKVRRYYKVRGISTRKRPLYCRIVKKEPKQLKLLNLSLKFRKWWSSFLILFLIKIKNQYKKSTGYALNRDQKKRSFFSFYLRRWFLVKYMLISSKLFLELTLKNSLTICNVSAPPKIFFIFLMSTEFVLTAALLTRFVSVKLSTNFPVFSVLRFVLKCLYDGFRQQDLVGFRIMFSGRFARRGRSRYLWNTGGAIAASTLSYKIEYSLRLVTLVNSVCGIKIWLALRVEPKRYAVL